MTPAALVQWVAAACACVVLVAFTVLVFVSVWRSLLRERPPATPRVKVPGQPMGPDRIG